jgi:hypothetical protein
MTENSENTEPSNSTKPMLNDGFKIQVGQIFEVIADDFYASKDIERVSKESYGGREARFYLKKGEKIEIRFPFEWNYRTEDNIYFHSENDYILSKCKLIGKVEAKVKSNNKATLEEILRLELYDKV